MKIKIKFVAAKFNRKKWNTVSVIESRMYKMKWKMLHHFLEQLQMHLLMQVNKRADDEEDEIVNLTGASEFETDDIPEVLPVKNKWHRMFYSWDNWWETGDEKELLPP